MLVKHNAEIIDGDHREKALPELRRIAQADQQSRGRPVLRLRLDRPLLAGREGAGACRPRRRRCPTSSIDIETTGLDPATCQTLEVGAVIDDWKTPIDQLQQFRRVLTYEIVAGSRPTRWR